MDDKEFDKSYANAFKLKCAITDLKGNHCPEEPKHTIELKIGELADLCDKCYENYKQRANQI